MLLAVDGSSASVRAAEYAARWLAGTRAGVVVVHVLEPIPPSPLELGGSRGMHARLLRESSTRWVEADLFEARPLLRRAREVLVAGGVDPGRIEGACYAPGVDASPARGLLSAAGECGCATIVVGRGAYPWFLELFHRHVSDDLVASGRGIAVWVVE